MALPDPECPACGGATRITNSVRHRDTVAVVARCTKCGRLDGRLTPGPHDPAEVHQFVRRQLNKMLGRTRKARAR